MLTIIAPMEQELAGIRRALRARRPIFCCVDSSSPLVGESWDDSPHPRPLSQRERGDRVGAHLCVRPAPGQTHRSAPTVHHPSGERGDQAEGEVGVRGLDLHVIGIGKERAQASARRLLAFRQWSARDQLLLLGFAGGVDPALKSGDLVLSSRYYRADGVITPPSPPFSRGGTLSIPPLEKGGLGGVSPLAIEQQDFLEPDSNMWRQAIEVASEVGLSVSQGSSLTVDQVVATPEAKKAAYSQCQVS